jgi:hypothetical protein
LMYRLAFKKLQILEHFRLQSFRLGVFNW